MVDLLDSYSETNQDGFIWLMRLHPSPTLDASGVFQSFKPSLSDKLTQAKFYLKRGGNPDGLKAYLYEHTGTYGSSSKPTGSPLAESDEVDASIIPTANYELIEFNFTGDNQYQLTADTPYCITVQTSSGTWNGSNWVAVGEDNSSPTHLGNTGKFVSNNWTAINTSDAPFYVYGIKPAVGGVLGLSNMAMVLTV